MERGKQEYSSRSLGATWGIISAIFLPIVVVLICIGFRFLKRRKRYYQDANDFMTIKSRPLDPDESMKINSDDESIPYKKDLPEDSPEPTEPLRVVDNPEPSGYPYGQAYDPPPPPPPLDQLPPPNQLPPLNQPVQRRQWDGETEIN